MLHKVSLFFAKKLCRYLPNFGEIVGRMQYDLFHAYTVDQHTLLVLRNLRRFLASEFADLPEGETRCTLSGLSFRRGHRETLPAEVPPVLLAECHADYRAVADAVAEHGDRLPCRMCTYQDHHEETR